MFGSANIYGKGSSIKDASLEEVTLNNSKIGETTPETGNFTTATAVNVTVTDSAVIKKDLLVEEDIVVKKDLVVEEDAVVQKDLTVEDNLLVKKDLTVDDNLLVKKDVTVDENVLVKKDITIDDSATIKKDLIVEENAIIQDNLSATNITVSSNLQANAVQSQNVIADVSVQSKLITSNGSGHDLNITSHAGKNVSVAAEQFQVTATETIIQGNLTVIGATETIESSEVFIKDPITVQGKGNTDSSTVMLDLGWLGETKNAAGEKKLVGVSVASSSNNDMYFVRNIDESSGAGLAPAIIPGNDASKLCSVHARTAFVQGTTHVPQLKVATDSTSTLSVDGEQTLWLLKNHKASGSNNLFLIQMGDGDHEGQLKNVMHVSKKANDSDPDPVFTTSLDGEVAANSFVLELDLNKFQPPAEVTDTQPLMTKDGYRIYLDNIGQSANLVWVSGKWFFAGANNCRVEYKYS